MALTLYKYTGQNYMRAHLYIHIHNNIITVISVRMDHDLNLSLGEVL